MYFIDTKPLPDKHSALILENDEEEELDLGNVESTVPQEPIQLQSEQTKQPPMEQLEPVEPEQVTASLQTEQEPLQTKQKPVVSQLIVPSTSAIEWLRSNYKTNQQWILPLALPLVFPYINYFDGVVTTQISLVLRFYGINLRNLLYSNRLYKPNGPVIIDAPIDQQELAELSKTNYIILNTPYDGLNLYQLPILTPEQMQNIPGGIYLELQRTLTNIKKDYDTLVNESLTLPVHKRDGYITHKIVSMLLGH